MKVVFLRKGLILLDTPMLTQYTSRLQRRFANGSLAAAAAAAVVGALALAGWGFDLPLLRRVLPSGVDMNPATAVTFITAAAALWLSRPGGGPRGRRLGRACGILVAAAGGLVLGKYLLGWDHGLDTFLFRGKLGDNRMAPNTAAVFVLIGSALALLDLPGRRGHWPSQALALLALALCGLVLVGYTFGVQQFYGVRTYIPMAFNSALVFTALAVGALLARPDRGLAVALASDGTGGALARRLMPAAVGFPWVLGWLRLAGERAGLYDTGFGVALMTLSLVGLLLALIWLTAGSLDRADAKRRRAEEVSRKAAEEVRDLYDNAPCGYHSLGPDGTVVAINRTELRWLGYAAEEVVGRMKFADLLTEESRRRFLENFPRFKEQGEARDLEFELVRRDGSAFPVLLNATAVRDADGRYVTSRSTLFDLTDRKRAEDAVRRLNVELEERVRERTAELAVANEGLRREVAERARVEVEVRRSEARKAAVLAGALDCIVTIDGAGRVVEFNPAAERTFGYRCEEAVGRDMAELIVPPRLQGDHRGGLARYLATGEGPVLNRRIEMAAVRADGGEFPIELAITVSSEDPPLFTGFIRDITERRRAEEAVRQRTTELAEANRDLDHKNQENEMFVYSVSHDLRSPLVNLQGFSKELEKAAQVLAQHLADETVPPAVRDQASAVLDGKMAKSIRFIQTAVMRLSGIIDALLRLSRVGRIEYRWELVDVGRVVRRVVEALQGTIAERQSRVEVGDLPAVWGDAGALEQVFANLIGNALTYLDPARPGVVEVGCLPPGEDGSPTYFVKDNGLGIAEGNRAKIFQAFQRVHPGVSRGEGLGLAIVARVAERHRGKVWVESRVGEGSTFFVALPAGPRRATR